MAKTNSHMKNRQVISAASGRLPAVGYEFRLRPANLRLIISILVMLTWILTVASGDAAMRSTLTPRVSLQGQYDDNIGLTPENEIEDWITLVSPGLSYVLDSKTTSLDLDYEAGFAFYRENPSRDTTRHRGRVTWDQELSRRFSLQLNDVFIVSEDPITVFEGQIVDILQDREKQYRNIGDVGLSWQFGAEDLITAGYRNYYFESDSNRTEDSRANEGFLNLDTWFVEQFGINLTANLSRWNFLQPEGFTGLLPSEDFYQYGAGLTGNYRWRPSRRVYARYSLLRQDFDRTVPGITEDYWVHEVVFGFGFTFSPQTEFAIDAGHYVQDFEDRKGRDGPAFNASLNTRTQRASFSITGNIGYDIDYGTTTNFGFTEVRGVFGSADYLLKENLRAFVSGDYRWRDYIEVDRTDETWGARVGAAYSFWRWFTVTLEGGHAERTSTSSAAEFRDNRVTLRLTAGYPWVFGGGP